MSPRALGALLATLAAVAFVLSIATSAWWSGSPVVDGNTIGAKHVGMGLLGATGCNTGGDGRCEPVDVEGTVRTLAYCELGLVTLATLLSIALAVCAWNIAASRRGVAIAALVACATAGVGAIVLLMMGPGIVATQTVSVPVGWGAFVFGGGLVASATSALITRGLEREPLRLAPASVAPVAPAPALDLSGLTIHHDGAPAPQVAPIRPTPMPTRARTELGTGRPSQPALPVLAPPAPAPARKIITGESRDLNTVQREVARAPTEDPFQTGRADVLVPPDGALSDDDEAPVTEAMDVPLSETPACPQCDAPMAWNEEHLRFYCKQCRMYF